MEATILDKELRKAGIPIEGVKSTAMGIEVLYDHTATEADKATAEAIIANYSSIELAYRKAEIDAETGASINKVIHPFAGLEEQIAILRDQLVHIINDLGLTPTADFERLNSIAVAQIEEGAKKKEAVDA